jgi:hypothetical protein
MPLANVATGRKPMLTSNGQRAVRPELLGHRDKCRPDLLVADEIREALELSNQKGAESRSKPIFGNRWELGN